MHSSESNSEKNVTTVEVFDGGRALGFATVTGNSWTLDVAWLTLGDHVLTARSGTSASSDWKFTVTETDPGLNLTRPSVQEARPEVGEKERLNYYDVNGDVHVVIPAYGMKSGDTVKLYWSGRNITLGSPIKVVGSPPALDPFTISKYEVIDVILGNASIWYTVKRPPNEDTYTSLTRELIVDGHAYTVDAPTINGAHDNLRVTRQSQFNNATTVEVRAIGGDADSDVWSSDTMTFGDNREVNFSIDSNWRARHRAKPVKFNCSIRVNPSDGSHYLLSQLRRVSSL